MIVKLSPASNDSKYTVKVGSKTVHFGLKGMSDFTQNKSEDRKQAYIARHQKRENQYWDSKNPDNLRTASFWSRFLLWETPTIQEAIKQSMDDISKTFGIYGRAFIEEIIRQKITVRTGIQ